MNTASTPSTPAIASSEAIASRVSTCTIRHSSSSAEVA